ncbi:MAG: RnfABCDGE type electron transport complex subunit G [Peptostreptococcaceae bacterium]
MKDIFKLGSILFLICAVAALMLTVTNNVTSPVIEKINIQANNESRKEVLQEAEEFKKLENIKGDLVEEVYQGSKGGEVVGYTIKTTPKGYGGQVEVMVGISKNGEISGVKIGNHSETPGLGSKASEPAFKDQFKGKNTEKSLTVVKGNASNDNDISAISGATITSKAVTSGVNAAMDVYINELANSKTSGNDSIKNEPMIKIYDEKELKDSNGTGV